MPISQHPAPSGQWPLPARGPPAPFTVRQEMATGQRPSMSLSRTVAPVPAPTGAPALQRQAQAPATQVGTRDAGQCPCTEPDPPTSHSTHSCQTSSTIHSNASTCPCPACTHHGSPLHRHCHHGYRPLRPRLPVLDTNTAPATACPCAHLTWPPQSRGTGHQYITAAPQPCSRLFHNHARRSNALSHLVHKATPQAALGSHRGSRGHRPPANQPSPMDVAPGPRDPEPSLSCARSTPAMLRHRSVPHLLPAWPPGPARIPASTAPPQLSARALFTAPMPHATPADSTCRQEQAGAPCCCCRVGGGDNQHRPGRGRHVHRRAPVRLCAS
ncbi:uncharacterized protein LOC129736418 [Falco cherrug]|uniref:uncharacterized protein LOC129736418 n=1 Tax=Falco cherrug TaxID=345164 RepID=UPI002478D334|nr:uncharacterized protein LOC129736418 [Falco cherrug]